MSEFYSMWCAPSTCERTFSTQGHGVDYLVLWLDCDKEGENICFEVTVKNDYLHGCNQYWLNYVFLYLVVFILFLYLYLSFLQVINEVKPVMKEAKYPNAQVCGNSAGRYSSSPICCTKHFPLLVTSTFFVCLHHFFLLSSSDLSLFVSFKTVLRAKFSSITAPAILHAFSNLILPNYNEARSVDARQEADLRIGCSFTRFQTTLFQVGGRRTVPSFVHVCAH